jgi:DNA-binding transcriptional MocR family regulator
MEAQKEIHLERNFPPVPPDFGHSLRSSLQRIADAPGLDELMRFHRYGESDGDRIAGAKWLASRFGNEDLNRRIVLTNGAKNGVLLVLSMLAGPGDIVATEEQSALGAWAIAKQLGIGLVGVPIDDEGIVPDAFEQICRARSPKALFTVPTLHNPTTHILGLPRRRRIAEIARDHGVAIVEDDICGMLMPDAPPPFAAVSPQSSWFVTGVGKSLSPGFRFGYVVAPSPQDASDFIARFRSTTTWVPSPLSASIVASWINDGTAFRMLSAIRDEVEARQAIVAEMLPGADLVSKPWALNGWLRLPSDRAASDLMQAARARSVLLGPTSVFSTRPGQPANSVRLCIGGPVSRDELRMALDVVAGLI